MPSSLLDTAVIARAANHLWCDLGAEIVVLRARDGTYYRLEATGRALWLLLEEPRTLGELVSALATDYDGDPGVVAADTREFVDQCAEIGLLALGGDLV